MLLFTTPCYFFLKHSRDNITLEFVSSPIIVCVPTLLITQYVHGDPHESLLSGEYLQLKQKLPKTVYPILGYFQCSRNQKSKLGKKL